jgi:hypothetical protein
MDPGHVVKKVMQERFADFAFRLLMLQEYKDPIHWNLDQGVYVLKERYPNRRRPFLRRGEFPGGELRAEVRGRHYEYETWKEPGHKMMMILFFRFH